MRVVGERMNHWLQCATLDHPGGRILAFTHGVTIRCLAGLLEGWPEDRIIWRTATPNTSITAITVAADKAEIEFLGQSIASVPALWQAHQSASLSHPMGMPWSWLQSNCKAGRGPLRGDQTWNLDRH